LKDARPDVHELPTPRTTLAVRYVDVLVRCRSCRPASSHRRYGEAHRGRSRRRATRRPQVPLRELPEPPLPISSAPDGRRSGWSRGALRKRGQEGLIFLLNRTHLPLRLAITP